MIVGIKDAALEGFSDRVTVGNSEFKLEGACEVICDGLNDAAVEGFSDIITVGNSEFKLDGDFDLRIDGLCELETVGVTDAAFEGCSDPAKVGAGVGVEVGIGRPVAAGSDEHTGCPVYSCDDIFAVEETLTSFPTRKPLMSLWSTMTVSLDRGARTLKLIVFMPKSRVTSKSVLNTTKTFCVF